MLFAQTFWTTSSIVILSRPATAGLLSSTPWNEPTIMSAAVAGTFFRPPRSYTNPRDVTPREDALRAAASAAAWTPDDDGGAARAWASAPPAVRRS